MVITVINIIIVIIVVIYCAEHCQLCCVFSCCLVYPASTSFITVSLIFTHYALWKRCRPACLQRTRH